MRYVSLFTGIGAAGLAVGEHFGATMVAACEQDAWCQRVIARHNPGVPIFDDVRTVGAHNLPAFDILEAGFPCQDLSSAGRQAGLDGARSGLYGEVLRIAGECLPRFVFIENAPALLKYRGRLERDFARIGYGLTWAKVAAQHVEGCPHKRMRVFVLAALGGRHRGVCDAGPLPQLQVWQTPRSHAPFGAEMARNLPSLAAEVLPSSQWPTPTVSTGAQTTLEPTPGQTGGNSLPGVVRWHTPAARDWKDGSYSPNVSLEHLGREVVAPAGACANKERLQGLPSGAVRWATPAASDMRDRGDMLNTPAVARRLEIGKQLGLSMQAGARLSPMWVEMLQGLPVGYTSDEGEPMRAEAVRLMHNPSWPAPMVKGLWGDSPQFDHEPSRVVPKGWGKKGERAARLRALGNLNPPQLYLRALQMLEQGPQQQSLFGMC